MTFDEAIKELRKFTREERARKGLKPRPYLAEHYSTDTDGARLWWVSCPRCKEQTEPMRVTDGTPVYWVPATYGEFSDTHAAKGCGEDIESR